MKQSDVPLTVIAFNRPSQTAQLVTALEKVKPKTIFVVIDGPRRDSDDSDKVNSVISILDNISWRCDIYKNISKINLGCKNRVSSGISWALSQVEETIILEDDCVPSPRFFTFCSEILERYRCDERIGSVSGMNFANGFRQARPSYSFSRYNLFWGWATWRRAWEKYENIDIDSPRAEIDIVIEKTFDKVRERLYWQYILEQVRLDRINSWGYRWIYSCWKNGMLGVMPSASMVTNIGFEKEATHTRSNYYNTLVTEREMERDLIHPVSFDRDALMDSYIEDTFYSRSLRNRLTWLYRRMRFK